MLPGAREGCLLFWGPPALLRGWEDGSILQTAGLKSWQGQNPLQGEKAGRDGEKREDFGKGVHGLQAILSSWYLHCCSHPDLPDHSGEG